MTTDLLSIYQSFLQAQGIQFLCLNDNFDNIIQIDFGFRNSVFDWYDYTLLSGYFKIILQDYDIIMVKDRLQMNYCIFEFPPLLKEEYHITYGIIGPVVFEPSTPMELKRKLKENNINENFYSSFVDFYNQVPNLHSIDFWHSLLRPFFKEIFGKEVSYHITNFNENSQGQLVPTAIPDTPSLKSIEDRYYIEQQLLEAVSKGEKEVALDWLKKVENERLLPRSSDEIRHKKNLLIVLNTLLRKAIQTAGIHPYYIDQISYEQALEIEMTSMNQELDNLPAAMVRKYCKIVHNHNLQSHSTPVERCIQYIEFYYAEPLTLEKLAQHCFVTSNYLSSLFKKEMGITLKEYINQVRIGKSISLLNTTQLSIQEIANRCGFPDANYYSRIFKKVNSITPLNYRKKVTQL